MSPPFENATYPRDLARPSAPPPAASPAAPAATVEPPVSGWVRVRRSPWLRTALSSVFVLFMLAAAHLFMVVINAAEHHYAAPRVEDGAVARLYTDRPLAEELAVAIRRARTPETRAPLEAALAQVERGEALELRVPPVTPFLAWTAVGLCVLGLVLLLLTARLESDATQSIVGIFAGNLLWTGGVEYGLVIAARTLGVGKNIGVVDGHVVATFGEYVLLKHTWGLMGLVLAYLLFLESSRCTLFLGVRERIQMMRGPLTHGRIGNYGPRTAFQYASTVWAFYLLLLWAYDEHLFGVHSWTTYGILFGSLAGSVYCVYRLHQQTGWGPAVRYAVPAMIVVWTPIEILAKWNVFREPWLLLEPGPGAVFFGGLAVGTWALWRAQRRQRLAMANAAAAARQGPPSAGGARERDLLISATA
jgi:hypothetical protein